MINYSIVLTVHNKDFLVGESLERIKKFTKGSYEIIVVLDGCSDNSEIIVNDFFKKNPKIKNQVLYADDVFETKANNMGMKSSESDTIIIVQDDMLINEDFWNVRLTKPFREYKDVFAVSANCAHNWVPNPNSIHINLTEPLNNCWSDIITHVDHAGRPWGLPRDIFAIRSSVNRGPLAINHDDLESLNYLDENYAPLDMDDHDLCFRMHKQIGKIVGCYWIDFISDFSWGGTHTPTGHKPWFYESNHKNTRQFWEKHGKDIENKRIIENRKL
jgi:glycosyltransferase involved in cell wall biosynthesis